MPRKPKGPYYTLLENDGKGWTIEFGDYDRKVVKEEIGDRKYNYKANGLPKVEFKIVRTETDLQKEIDEVVAELNS